MIIRFPNLHFYVEGVPRAYRLLGAEFTMYGTMIAIGMLLGLFTIWIQAGRQGKNTNRIFGAAITGTIGAVVGGRALYVLLNWKLYKGDLVRILRIRDGGMAVYGAILGGILFVLIYCLITGNSYLQTMDVLVLGACLAQVVGRWGDYFNRSSFGEYTNWFWAMQLPIADVRSEEVTDLMRENLVEAGGVTFVQVTPVFFLESLLCLILLFWLLYSSRHRSYDGQVYLEYMTGYGVIRFACEWLRTDKLQIPGFSMGASLVFSLAFILYFGLQGLIRSSLQRKRDEVRLETRERHLREESAAAETPDLRENPRTAPREDDRENFSLRIEKRRENTRPDVTDEEKEAIRERIQEERENAYKKELEEKLQNQKGS